MRTITTLAIATAGLLALGVTASTLQAPQQRPGTAGRTNAPATGTVDTDEDGQPRTLPALPAGMTISIIQQGDDIFHGKGGCVTCHGPDALGVPASGSALTHGVAFIPPEWKAIDSLITAGMPEDLTRTPIAMPARGAQSNLTPDEVRLVAAYVWAIGHVRGEPWPGGHRTHVTSVAAARQP